MIDELATIILTKDLPEQRLKAGDVGTVVHVYSGSDLAPGGGYEVEFTTLDGTTIFVATLPSDAVRPAAPNEIASARLVA
jgi:hypothetical protein